MFATQPNLVFFTPEEIGLMDQAWERQYAPLLQEHNRQCSKSWENISPAGSRNSHFRLNPDNLPTCVIPPRPSLLYDIQKNETWRYDSSLVR